MSAATTDAPPARLKTRYLEEIRPAMMERFGYSSVMEAPRVQKITLNMGVGGAKQDSKVLKAASEQLATIAGQAPSVRRARKSIAAFKLREGNPVGVAVTLRSERAYEFLDRLVSIAIPRIRDFRGLNPRSFDGRGNYSMGVREQIIFPEIDYDAIDEVRGLDITVSTSARTDAEAFALLLALGMPFATQGRPRGFEDLSGSPSDDGAAETEEAAAETEAAGDELAEEAAAETEAAGDELAEETVAAGAEAEDGASTAEPAADAVEAPAAGEGPGAEAEDAADETVEAPAAGERPQAEDEASTDESAANAVGAPATGDELQAEREDAAEVPAAELAPEATTETEPAPEAVAEQAGEDNEAPAEAGADENTADEGSTG